MPLPKPAAVVKSVAGAQWAMRRRWRDPLEWILSPSRIMKSLNQPFPTSNVRGSGDLSAPAVSLFMENIGQTLKELGCLESLSMWREAPVTIWDKKKRHLKVDLRIKLISIFLFSKGSLSILMIETPRRNPMILSSSGLVLLDRVRLRLQLKEELKS